MTYPYPLGLDPSHWSGILNWQKAKANGISFAIIKAKDGINNVRFFKENYKGAKDAGITVGAYLWLYPASVVSPGRQAREFAALLKDYPLDLPPAIDFEWTYQNPRASDLYGCVVPLLSEMGIPKAILYTAVGYWNEFGTRDPGWPSMFHLWQAQYKVLAPSKMLPFGTWDYWQFTDQGDGQLYGFPRDGETRCTLNYAKVVIPSKPEPPKPEPPVEVPVEVPGEVTELFGGAAKMWHPVYKGAQCHAIELDLDKWDTVTDDGYAPASTTNFLAKKGVQIAINGLDGYASGHLQGVAASKGRLYNLRRIANEQTLWMSKDNKFSLRRQRPIWNACSFPNLLIKDGVVQRIRKALDDIRARTSFGVNRSQTKAYLLVVDGGDYNVKIGLNVQDTAALMLEFGCDLAVLADSGGSTTMVIEENGKAKIIGKPSGENADGQRSVAQHLGFRRR